MSPFEARYQRPRCRGTQCEIGEIRVAGSALASLFDVEGRRFTGVTCTRCSYTEFYKTVRDRLSEVADFLIS